MYHRTIINNIYSFYKNMINYNKLVHSIFYKYISGFLTFALHFYTPTHSEHSEVDGSEWFVAMTPVVMSSAPYLLFTLASFCSTVNLPSVLDKFKGGKNTQHHISNWARFVLPRHNRTSWPSASSQCGRRGCRPGTRGHRRTRWACSRPGRVCLCEGASCC